MITLGAATKATFPEVPNGNGFLKTGFGACLRPNPREGLKPTIDLSGGKIVRNYGNSSPGSVGRLFGGRRSLWPG